jgi:cellulose synthase/poly-beta-1,6-N-acetylglucosamine synthase-like glycosyltransferase
MTFVFWASLLFLFYVFIGYPALLAAMGSLFRRPVHKRPIEPKVTIIVAARNEAARIGRRLGNLMSLDYPREKLQIIVSLDGPTDGTEKVVENYSGIELVHSRWHRGKAAAINDAMARATGDVVLFADARQTFNAQTVRELVANFADCHVGAVTGELVLTADNESESSQPLGLYWHYEKKIRSLESKFHSVVGVTGAIYAIRRELYKPLPDDTLLDDVMSPMRIVLSGKRVVFDSAAKAYDSVACCPRAEFHRKVRTLAGNYQLLGRMPELLVPVHNPIFWQFVSHKVARLLAPYAMAALFISNALLVDHAGYAILFVAQSLWYTFALIGHAEVLHEAGEPVAAAFEERSKAA